MSLPGVSFADANSSYEEADFVIYGIPFDRTCSYRAGCREGPNEIRKASYNFEAYLFEHGVDLSELRIHDAGNMDELGLADDMVAEGEFVLGDVVTRGKFPITLGGEHSVSIPAVRSFEDIGVISIDAHLDWRDSYLGVRNSHASAVRRFADHVDRENVLVFGVRSISREEYEDSPPSYIDAFTIKKEGVAETFKSALNMIRKERVYLTVDIDGIDPAFAPATGTPEPFGLSPCDVKECINLLGRRMVGFDVVEVSPPYDKGNTAALAARLVREAIAVASKYR